MWWRIGLQHCSNVVGFLEPKEYYIFLPGVHYLTHYFFMSTHLINSLIYSCCRHYLNEDKQTVLIRPSISAHDLLGPVV